MSGYALIVGKAPADGEGHADTFRLNQTGLNGAYDFKVEWTVEMDRDSATGPALQDRLGLKTGCSEGSGTDAHD